MKAKEKEKSGKVAGKVVAKKSTEGKTKYGHVENKISGQLDVAFEKGGTFESISKDVKTTISRAKDHYKHLVKDKKVEFVVTGDTYKIKK
jgi:hypothetical protein